MNSNSSWFPRVVERRMRGGRVLAWLDHSPPSHKGGAHDTTHLLWGVPLTLWTAALTWSCSGSSRLESWAEACLHDITWHHPQITLYPHMSPLTQVDRQGDLSLLLSVVGLIAQGSSQEKSPKVMMWHTARSFTGRVRALIRHCGLGWRDSEHGVTHV